MGHGIALLDDYTVADDSTDGRLVRLLPDYNVTNSHFDEGVSAAFLQTLTCPRRSGSFSTSWRRSAGQ